MKWWRRAGYAAAGSVAAGFAWVAYAYLTSPDVRPLGKENPTTTAFIELRAREARGDGREPRRSQRWVGYDKISPHLKRAVLLAEDAAFWEHEGVDYYELRQSIKRGLTTGQWRGASTITQQLAKNLYLSPSRSPTRKLRELIIARRLEAELDKARIFEIYLNVIEWGDGIYGAEAASRAYFGMPASAIGQSQAALLAAAIINPRLFSPAAPNARLTERQQLILRRMRASTPADPSKPSPDDIVAPPLDEFLPLPGQSTDDELAPAPDESGAPGKKP
jgi:monofunctional biosynthetic peptidoglycan transglycosylase